MSLRVVCVSVDFGLAANIGGPVQQHFKTFDIDCPDVLALEQWLSAHDGTKDCISRSIVGVEIVESWVCPQCDGAGWYVGVTTNAAGDGPEQTQEQCDCEGVRRRLRLEAQQPKKTEAAKPDDDIPF